MLAYVIRRLIQGVPTLVGVALLIFFILAVFGGDPVSARLGKSANPEDIEALRREFGLDDSYWRQLTEFFGALLRLDLGRSFVTREPVADILKQGLGPSISITAPALFLTTLVSVTIGLISAFHRGRLIDRGLVAMAVFGMSISFLVYIVAGQYFLAFRFGWFQVYGYESGLLERWQYLALPILIQVVVATGYDVRFYRAVMVEETTRLHVKTAFAKGLSRGRVMFKHVLKNALIPIITRVMISVPFLLTGSVLVESFFGIPGLGLEILGALNEQDYPVIRAITMLVSVCFILGNIVTDLLYAAVDPRVRLQ